MASDQGFQGAMSALLPLAFTIIADELVKNPLAVKPEIALDFIINLSAAHARKDIEEAKQKGIELPSAEAERLHKIANGDRDEIIKNLFSGLVMEGTRLIRVSSDCFIAQDLAHLMPREADGTVSPQTIEILKKSGFGVTPDKLELQDRNYRTMVFRKEPDGAVVLEFTELGSAIKAFLFGRRIFDPDLAERGIEATRNNMRNFGQMQFRAALGLT